MPKQPGEIYLELNVEYYLDDAVAGLGADAEVLFIRGLCLARKLMTDGRLGTSQVARLGADLDDVAAAAKALVDARLWRAVKGGWVITNFLKRNPSRAQIVARSEEKAIAGAYGNHVKYHADSPRRSCDWCSGRAQPPSSHQRSQERPHQRRTSDRTSVAPAIASMTMSDPSESTSESTSESGIRGTDPGEVPTARAKRNTRRGAGASYLEIDPDDRRWPVARVLATRFGFTRCSPDQWAMLAEVVDNEYPAGTKRGRDPLSGWRWLARELGKLGRDAGGPIDAFLASYNAELEARRAAAARAQAQHEQRVASGGGPVAAALVERMVDAGANGHHPERLSREDAIAKWRPYYGQLAEDLLERQIAPYGLTLADLEDPVDFTAPQEAAADD